MKALFRPQPHQRIKNHANDKENRGENDRKSHVGRYVAQATPEDEDLTRRVSDLCPREHVVGLERRPKRCSKCFIGERKERPVEEGYQYGNEHPSCVACRSLVINAASSKPSP